MTIQCFAVFSASSKRMHATLMINGLKHSSSQTFFNGVRQRHVFIWYKKLVQFGFAFSYELCCFHMEMVDGRWHGTRSDGTAGWRKRYGHDNVLSYCFKVQGSRFFICHLLPCTEGEVQGENEITFLLEQVLHVRQHKTAQSMGRIQKCKTGITRTWDRFDVELRL